MKNGTPTTLKYLYPYRKGWCLGQGLTPKANIRLKWIEYVKEGNNVLKASRHFDIPEATIRYWKHRYDRGDLLSLEDRSKRPKKLNKCRLSFQVIERVVELRQEYKGWGKDKIQILLRREGIEVGRNRIQKIINSSGLKRISIKRRRIKRQNRQHMYAVPREMLKIPGGLVYVDVKHLTLAGWGKIYQFTAIDHATRMMRIKVYPKINSLCGKEFLEYLDKHFPFNRIIYLGSDNGSEFLGEMEKELSRRGIKHVFSSPRSPKQNPFVERLIRTTIDEIYYYQGTEVNIWKQQEVLDKYVKVYNKIRPHKSLDMKTPYEKYIELKNAPNSQDV
jgi:transposase InsO family protein